MKLETERLIITEFDLSMVKDVHLQSLDEDTRAFLPDEVFETVEDAAETVQFLISVYQSGEGPLVYPVLLKDSTYIGYVQFIPTDDGYEVGYHIGKAFTQKGYATEALKPFTDYMMQHRQVKSVYGICVAENIASQRVLEKCGFTKVFDGIGTYQGKERPIVKYVYEQK